MLLPWPAAAQQGPGGITIAPTRLVFEGRNTSGELVLVNRGTRTTTYRISTINMRMTSEGRLEQVEEPEEGQPFADNMLRFSPRQVTLEPGVAQRVRVMVRKPAELPPGEYRSHLQFQSIPEAGDPDPVDITTNQLGIRLNIISGLSIAVIVRHGELDAKASIADATLVRDLQNPDRPPVLNVKMEREGTRSVYGDLRILYQSNKPGSEPLEVAQAKGVAVYTPISYRYFRLPLPENEDRPALRDGKLLIQYQRRAEEGGDTLAVAELVLP